MLKSIALYLFMAAVGSFINISALTQEEQEFLAINSKEDALAFKKRQGDPGAVTDAEMEYLAQIKKAIQAQQAGKNEEALKIFDKAITEAQ